ncbi:MAG: hypothetical protein [Bacteriophage sp.]|nr:MAG: hypothetical protein [Bacteriophage sp.]UWG10513.1 MAG: hypothetical protein [Bacteriophage sp.]
METQKRRRSSCREMETQKRRPHGAAVG